MQINNLLLALLPRVIHQLGRGSGGTAQLEMREDGSATAASLLENSLRGAGDERRGNERRGEPTRLRKSSVSAKIHRFSSSTILDPTVFPLRPLFERPSSSGVLLLALLGRFHGVQSNNRNHCESCCCRWTEATKREKKSYEHHDSSVKELE